MFLSEDRERQEIILKINKQTNKNKHLCILTDGRFVIGKYVLHCGCASLQF